MMRKYEIIDDSEVDYKFIGAFGHNTASWLGQVVNGHPAHELYKGAVTVEKPFGLQGWYIADESCFRELSDAEVAIC